MGNNGTFYLLGCFPVSTVTLSEKIKRLLQKPYMEKAIITLPAGLGVVRISGIYAPIMGGYIFASLRLYLRHSLRTLVTGVCFHKY